MRLPNSGASAWIRPDCQKSMDRRSGGSFPQEVVPGVPISTVEPIVRISRDHFHGGNPEWGNIQGGTHAQVRQAR